MKLHISIRGGFDGKNASVDAIETSMGVTPDVLKSMLSAALEKVDKDVAAKKSAVKAKKQAKAKRLADAKKQESNPVKKKTEKKVEAPAKTADKGEGVKEAPKEEQK